ncbi:MAG: hypothetical protein AAB739_04930 [Patescibacteria group bacterium]
MKTDLPRGFEPEVCNSGDHPIDASQFLLHSIDLHLEHRGVEERRGEFRRRATMVVGLILGIGSVLGTRACEGQKPDTSGAFVETYVNPDGCAALTDQEQADSPYCD